MCPEDQAGTEVLPGSPETQSSVQTSAKAEETYKTPRLGGTSAGFSILGVFFVVFPPHPLPILLSTDIANSHSFVFNPREFALALPPPPQKRPPRQPTARHPYFH